MMLNFLEYQPMAFGVTSPFRRTESFDFHYFEPKGELAIEYGVCHKRDGLTERALLVLDSDGIIRWSYVSPIGFNSGAEGILKA
jgi:alkyl hydroperoxide reductase subunit AhpC